MIDKLNDYFNFPPQGQSSNVNKQLGISNKDMIIPIGGNKYSYTEELIMKLDAEDKKILDAMTGKNNTTALKLEQDDVDSKVDKETSLKNTQAKAVESETSATDVAKGKKAEKEAPARTSKTATMEELDEIKQKSREQDKANLRKYVQESHKNYQDALKKFNEACATGIRSKIREASANLKKAAEDYLSDEGNTIQDCKDMQLRIIQKYSNVPKEFIVGELMQEWTGKQWHHVSAEELCKRLGMSEEDTQKYLSLERQWKEIWSQVGIGSLLASNSKDG